MTVHVRLRGGHVTSVDDADEHITAGRSWYVVTNANSKTKYASTKIDGKNVALHRLIMNPADGLSVDHIDGNGLNNQRSNLRICTHAENSRNRSLYKNNAYGLKGVQRGPYGFKAHVCLNRKMIHVGMYKTPTAAARAYDRAAAHYHGEYAKLNFAQERDWLFVGEPLKPWSPAPTLAPSEGQP